MNNSVKEICIAARNASLSLAQWSTEYKNKFLMAAAQGLRSAAQDVLDANARDMELAQSSRPQLLDRLKLTPSRIEDMAKGMEDVAQLPDPVGEVIERFTRPNGLEIERVRVPLGVVGIIYEARPNVTADTIALCVKSGNSVVLRGSGDAAYSNRAIVSAIKAGLTAEGFDTECIQLLDDSGREGAEQLMRMNGYLDVLIPRGGAGLIASVVQNSTVPVIETGTGNCHVYVEGSADFDMATAIVLNSKVQRPSVCNAAESLLVDLSIAQEYLPLAIGALRQSGIVVKGCDRTCAIDPSCDRATDEDYAAEFLSCVISVKVVENLTEAIAHINKFGTRHSECIVTADADAAQTFLNAVDAAAVYVNASTRFTDGGQFGYGAELGISTQKLHARGPIGLRELTTYKYLVRGTGQVRE